MRHENADANQTDSHRYQLNHRTHRGRATPRSIKEALPFQVVTLKNGFVASGRRRNLARPCGRLAEARFSPALWSLAVIRTPNGDVTLRPADIGDARSNPPSRSGISRGVLACPYADGHVGTIGLRSAVPVLTLGGKQRRSMGVR